MNVLLMVLQKKNTRCLRSHSLTQVLLTQVSQSARRFSASHTCVQVLSLSARSLIQSLTRGAPTIHHHITLSSQKSGQISSMKRGKKDNTHRLTQYMQSEAVLFDGKAFTHGKKGTDTEIARTLRPTRGFFPGNWKRGDEL